MRWELNAETQRRKDAKEEQITCRRLFSGSFSFTLFLCVSALLRLCVKNDFRFSINAARAGAPSFVRFATFIAALSFQLIASAQNTVQWTTNYYAVTGASLAEIRESLSRSRPWKDKSRLDGLTEWHIGWRYEVTTSDAGCRCTSFATTTRIAITLPRWTRPTNAMPETGTNWDRYITALRQHELGHAQMGLAAAAEQQKRINTIGADADCDALKKRIDALAQQIVEDYTRRDWEYDERTEHGAKQGAFLPGRGFRSEPRRER